MALTSATFPVGSHANLAVGFSKTYTVPGGPTHGTTATNMHDARAERGNSLPDRKSLTFAIDLDGTLAEFDGRAGKFVGALPRPNAMFVCRRLYRRGHILLVDTVRPDEWLINDWLAEHFHTPGYVTVNGAAKHLFSGINCNPADVARHGIVAGHLYADVYINDRNWLPGREHGQQVDWYELEKDFESRGWI